MMMRERQKLAIKRSLLISFVLLNAVVIPLLVKTSIESTLTGTHGIFYNYLNKLNFTIMLIILLGLVNFGIVILGFFVDEFSLVKLLLAISNTVVSVFSLILWSALLVFEILVEGNYISIDLSGVFLITILFPLLYLVRSFFMFRLKRKVLWYQVCILSSISQNAFRNLHQLKKNILNSILQEKKGYLLKNFDALMVNVFEREEPLARKNETLLTLTDVGAELLYRYQTII
jgi:hypothetical protein